MKKIVGFTIVVELKKQTETEFENEVQHNLDKYLYPFEQACLSKQQSQMSIALPVLQKFAEMGLITSQKVDSIIALICSCFDTKQLFQEVVLVQCINALLTAFTNCDVNGKSLMLTVKTCFNILIITKDKNNHTIVMQALVQVLKDVFQRMGNSINEKQKDAVKSMVDDVFYKVQLRYEGKKMEFKDKSFEDGFKIFKALCRLSTKKLPRK